MSVADLNSQKNQADENTETKLKNFFRPVSLLWLIFAVINWPLLNQLVLTVDNEFAAVRTSPQIWLEQGRWGTFLLESILPEPVVVFFPLAFYGFAAAISYVILFRSIGRPSLRTADYLLFPIFCGFPTILFLEVFSVNILAQGCALLFASASVLAAVKRTTPLPDQSARWRRHLILCLIIACGTFCIAFYQSNICLLAAMMLTPWMAHYSQRTFRRNVTDLLMIGGYCLGSLGLYAVINSFLVGANSDEHVSGLLRTGDFFQHLPHVVHLTLNECAKVYSGDPNVYGVSGGMLSLFLAVNLVILAAALLKNQIGNPGKRLLLAAVLTALVFLPFAPHLLTGGYLATRTLVSVPFCCWLVCFACVSLRPLCAANAMWLLLLILANLNLIFIHNYNQTQLILTMKNDRSTAESIVRECYRIDPNFDAFSGQYTLLTFGAIPSRLLHRHVEDSTVGSSIFEWDGGNPLREICYMSVSGIASFKPPTIEEKNDARNVFQNMPSWPGTGSLQISNKVVLVKLGSNKSSYWDSAEWDRYSIHQAVDAAKR